ncbi:MAG: hypothetical protein A2W25_10505 [candidate division Zixibacteria bacterium RBG_16_53_22]|nr:MAG: hypothetical protein A2W25_10505 [candidate division Zixibacteria bacterium RBG_16_53_22]
MSIELLFLVSIAVGFIGAMIGMRGRVVLIPALTLLGMDIKHAIDIIIISVRSVERGCPSVRARPHYQSTA